MVPVGGPPLPVIVAARVMGASTMEGLGAMTTLTAVVAWLTIKASGADALPAESASPE
jgi:hypothetical protein